MDTNETITVTISPVPAPSVAATSFTGSHIILDHNWLLTLSGRQYGVWQARGLDGCTLLLGQQSLHIPMSAPKLAATATSFFLAIGFLLVVGAKMFKQSKRA